MVRSQAVPSEYTPRRFGDIEERLRRLERHSHAALGFGAWTEYVPTWHIATGGFGVLGDGALGGQYAVSGSVCVVHMELVWGATTTGGADSWYFELPIEFDVDVDATGLGNWAFTGDAWYLDDSTVANFGSGMVAFTNTVDVDKHGVTVHPSGSFTRVSNSQPFTWATNDALMIHAVYPIVV